MNFKKIFPILIVALLAFSCNGSNSHIDIEDKGMKEFPVMPLIRMASIVGMVVSDGFSCVITDKEGHYSIESPSSNTFYIYASIPADCKIEENPMEIPIFTTNTRWSAASMTSTLSASK